MAKMFYSLTEAAERLGKTEDEIKQLAAGGSLQVFRDRDKIMFKLEEVDKLAGGPAASELSGTSIPLQDSGDTDALGTAAGGTGTSLGNDTAGASGTGPSDGISVFDADEIDAADPMAQTQVTQPGGGDSSLMLESVGSGSGLLDLTRESDDTSLGAELLDEIYPGDSAADTKVGALPGASGSFEGGEEGALGEGAIEIDGVTPAGGAVAAYDDEIYDPAGSFMGVGVLLVALVSLVVALIVLVHAVADVGDSIVPLVTRDANTLYMYGGGLIAAVLVFGLIGFFIGRARE